MSAAPPATAVAPTATPTTVPATPPTPTVTAPVKPAEEVRDQQTGKLFKKLPEQWYDIASAWFSAIYSLAVIGYLAFLVLYMRGNSVFWPEAATAQVASLLKGPLSRVILYTAIGGAMGAAVNNLRSFIAWHAEEKAFGWRFIWKYVAMPPLGGTLAVLVYGILQGGMAVINGGSNPNPDNPLTSLSAWATGTLAGYGSSKVFIWLDDKVNTLFKIDKQQVAVPDVKGKSLDEAKQMLSKAQLTVGKVSEQETSSDQVGKVIAQTPEAGLQLDCGSSLDLTVGIASPEPIVDPAITSGSQGGPQNGNGSSSNGKHEPVTDTATVTNVATGTETLPENGTGKVETTSGTDTTRTTSETAATETSTSETSASETTATETAATETGTSDTAATETNK